MLRTISCLVSLVISVCMCSYQSFAQLPTATLSGGDQTICANTPATIIITLTGTAPWTFVYTDPSLQTSNNLNVITINSSPYTLKVYPKFSETISAYSVSNLAGSGTVSGAVNITVTPNVSPSTIPAQVLAGPVISGPNPINCSLGQTLLTADAGHANYRWYKFNTSYNSYEEMKEEISQILNVTGYGAGMYGVSIVDANCTIYPIVSVPITITSTPPFSPPVITGNNTIQCGSPNTVLTASPGYSRYDWFLNKILKQSSSSNTIIANTFGVGDYTVKVYNQNKCYNSSLPFTVNETFSFKPVIYPVIPPNKQYVGCSSGNNTITATAGFSNYIWLKDNNVVQAGAQNSLVLNFYGSGTYKVIVYDAAGCNNTTDSYIVNLHTTTGLTSTSSFINCDGTASIITIDPPNYFYSSYLWSDGSTQPTLITNKSGVYSVTVKDASGCVSTASITLKDAPKQNVVINALAGNRVCQSGTTLPVVTLSSSVTDNNFSYQWYKDGVFYKPSTLLITQESGTYSLSLVQQGVANQGVCYNSSNTIDVKITKPPLSYAPAKFLCGPAATYTHTANGAGANQVYRWYADQTATAPLYISTGAADAGYVSTYASVFVSIYDNISGCETSRTNLFYSIDPLKLSDQTITVCDDGASFMTLVTDAFAGGGYYYIPQLGTFNSNSISIPKPTKNIVYQLGYTSPRNCNTTSYATITLNVYKPEVNISALSGDPNTNPFCIGGWANLIATNSDATSWAWYDSPTSMNVISSYSNYPVMVTGNKTYYLAVSNGVCQTTRRPVVVNAINPSADFTITRVGNLCQTVSLSPLNPAIPGVTYNWDFGVGNILSEYKNSITVELTGGNRIIALTLNDRGCIAKKEQYYALDHAIQLSLYKTEYCQNDPASVIYKYPTDGVLYINSSYTDSRDPQYFIPSQVGVNIIEYYKYYETDQCFDYIKKTITVNPLPTVSITGLNTSYCQASTGVPVTVSPAGGTLSGTGISGTTFTPSTQGQRTISYTYKDANNCSNTTTQSVTVNPVPTASFTGLDAGYCQNSPASVLTGTPSGGTFSGDGISGNTFTPTKAGTNTITYTYQPNGCGIPAVKTTMVSAQIIPAITVTSSVPLATCGQSVTYTAAWANINTPALQWYVNAQPVSGATASTYNRIAAFGDRVSCKASFTDICQKVPVELMSAVYEQSVVVPATNYLKLDGTDDKVTIPANTAYDLGSGDFTMEAFVIVDVRSTVPTPIVSKRTAAQGFVLYLNDNTLTLKIGSTVYTSSTFTSIKDQYLHQVGVSRQNGVITFYLDGRTAGTASSTLSINSTANLLLGSDAVDASYMKGYIQNVNFSSLANDFTSNAGLQIAPRSSAGIIGSWYMTGCSGQTYVKDYSIVSNNAYLGAVLGSESSDPVFSNPPVVILYNPNLNLNAVSFASETNNSRHIEIPNNGAYGAFNSNFTIEAFVQGANAGVNSYPTIFSKRSASTNGLAIGINNGKVFVSIGSNIFYDNGSYNLNNNNCNHIVLVGQRILNKTFFYVFVNGVQTYSFSMSGYFNTSDPIWIGNDRGTANVFNASIDEIRIWNSTRLPDQINANRNSIFNSSTPNLIGYYRFKENINSQVVTDGSSLGNPGFLGNSTALDINDPIRVNLTCSSNSRTASLEELPEPENISATEMQAPSILLYPNPFGTNCRLQIHHATGEATIHVMDAAGNVVFVKEKHPVSEELIFGDELPQGLYLLQFVSRPELKPVKFIKTR